MVLRVTHDGLVASRVVAPLHAHLVRARATMAVGSAHALEVPGLRAPNVLFWSVWEADSNATALFRQVVETACARAITRLTLATGSWPYSAPARARFAQHGFGVCVPFGDYRPDPNNVFMTRALPPR